MKHLYIYILFVSLCSCRQSEISTNNIESITIENAAKDDISFLEKIEVIPLQTDTNSLIKNINKLKYIKELDAYLILDSRQIVFLFDKNGQFISNSSEMLGEGPTEYWMAVDVEYNPFSKTIDLLNPNGKGKIICYDTAFQWKRKYNLNQKLSYRSFIPLKEGQYALTPSYYKNEDEMFISIYDYSDGETPIVNNIEYDGYIAKTNMNMNPYFQLTSGSYFTPQCIDYHFYKIDMEHDQLIPTIKLDFGTKNNISKEMLDDMFGTTKNKADEQKEMVDNVNLAIKKQDYLVESDFPLPIIRLMNDSFIYVHSIVNRKPSNFIYNRNTQKSYLLTKEAELKMPFSVWLEDNILYTFVDPYNMGKYINEEYMSKETIKKMESIKEDDNPVVIKYYLKK